MQTLIHNTTIVTADDAATVHQNAAILIDESRIATIGPSAELLTQYPEAERVNGRDKAVMPGFANTHTHLSLTLARGIYEDLSPPHKPPFEGGLAPLPLPVLIDGEHRAMCLLGAVEAIRSGTTLLLEDAVDIHRYAADLAASGLRLQFCERAWDRAQAGIGQPGPFEVEPRLAQQGLERIEALHSQWHGHGQDRIRVGLAAWAPDMCSPGLLRALREQQERLGVLATIHLNQMWGEMAAVRGLRGVEPTTYLSQCEFLSDRLIAAHCRCMTSAEEQLLGQSGAAVAFNAAIAARRGLSPRIAELETHGCTIAMGSDNMAEDMVEVMRTGLFMERVRRQDGRHPTPDEALGWATRHGYRALGVENAGWLAPGNKADLILADVHRAHLVPFLRPVSCFVHQGQARDIESVMVDGQWLMRDGRVLTLGEETIVREAGRVARTAWRRLFETRPDLTPPAGMTLSG
ncbi:amidohydrolase family protein [Candidatus Entotheonella palauensis]|uniref:amidohydrolase family protein n=1 Tax=Candidatus Entotheonella palauensis TaxID=93172 RepID=UPI000B7DD8D9|nr:amidohydrolase family protein [Candidatus Entotheonella palauensis]